MTEILYRWLDEELRIPVARDADTFLQQFSNGQLIGKILHVEGALPDKKYDQLRTNDLYEDRLHNFLVIGPYMKSLGVNLSVRQARDILSDKPGSLTYLIYQVYLALHKPRDRLRQPSPEPLPDAYKERLWESARPDLRDSGVTSLGLSCQCYGRDVTQTRITEGHLVKECQQRITKEGVKKKERAKDIKQQMTEEYMQGDSAKLWGRSFRSTMRSASRREKDRQKAEAAAVRQQIEHFANTADLRLSKYEDVRNAEFLQTTITPDMIPEALVNTEANQQFVHKLRNQLDRDTRARFDREKRRKQMYLALRDQQRLQEEEQRELDLVRRLLRQGDYELRLAAHLTDIKRQKQIIIRNRLEKDRQMQERRQEEYERSVQQQMDLLGQKRMEHQEELLKESQLHRRLLQQRRDQKSQRRWQVAADVVIFCLDTAVLTVDYKRKSGDKEVPASLQNDWRELFLRGESLSGGGDPAEMSATSLPEERQQALLQQQDLAEYLAVSGRWLIPGTSGKKRSASSQARDDNALRVESAVVTGFVVHRLLRLVYPPKLSVQAPDRPTFTLMAALMGKSYAGKTHCLQWVQSALDVRHIVMHDLVKRSLATLEQETRLELEAAGSGVMETLRIDDILGPDLSTGEMQRQESRQLAQGQRQETAADSPAGEQGDVRPDSNAKAGTEGQSGPTSPDAPRDDSAEAQSDVQKETGSQVSLKGRKSKESTTGLGPKSGKVTSSSAKSKKSSKSVSNSAESTESLKRPGDAQNSKEESSAETAGGSAEQDETTSGTKPASSSSTKDIPASELDKSKTTIDGGCASDEDTGTTSDDAVRFEYSQLAQLGREVKSTLERGEEVHDQTLADLLLEAWRELPDGSGWIVEGFPNTPAQAELLEEQLVGKQYDSDEELDEVEIVVTPLPKPEPPEDTGGKEKGKKGKKDKGKGSAKKGKKGKEEPPPAEEAPPSPPLPPPDPVRLRVKPFRRSQLVPDANRRERPPPTSGLDLVVELAVSDEVAQQRRCQTIDRVAEQPDSGNCQSASDDHITLAGKLFNYGRLREPLIEFYGERGVYHHVEADDLAAVESQLKRLISASRAKQREEHRLAERRAAQLAAAENEPDSEPEPEPEDELEVTEPSKGKGKSPRGGRKSDAKGKKGKGKGKGDAEPTPAEEDLPQIPAPPPMPTPGEMGYYFVDAPVPEGVAQYLALLWQQTERNYTENLKQWLGRLRLEHAAVIHHLHAITVSFNAFLLRPDHKQQFLDRFVTEYNQMEEALQCDEEVKCEWHLRIQELENTIWNITDTRRCEAEQERYTTMTSGWIEDRLALSANNWLMVMQSEMDRFQDTCLVQEDYYVSMMGVQLPENNGRVHGFKQVMIEIPSREPADRSGVSSAGSDGRHSGSRSSSSARPFRRGGGGRGADGTGSAGSAVLATIAIPQLRPRVQFVRGKNQADEVTTAVEGVIDSACKSMLSFAHDTKEKGDARVRLALLPPEEGAGKKGAKKAPAQQKPKSGGKKGAAAEEEAAIEAEKLAHREWAERALAEYQVAAREESSRVSARLALIRVRAASELAALRQRAVTVFHLMWAAIDERYRRELQAATHMADYLRGSVESQQRVHYQLLLDQDRFLVRTGVLTHLPCLPASPPPAEEALQRDRISMLQAAGLWRQLHTAAPSGTVTTRAFCFILQDLVACGVGTQELPALWMSLSQEEIESLSARLTAGAEVMSWRGLLYDLLEPWSQPDQYDLHEALAIAHVFDPQRTGWVTREQALQVVHWMKPRLEESDESYNRPYHTKRLLVDICGAPGDDTTHYQTLLTWLCRGEDVLHSFLCALTLLQDAPIFISNPEDDDKYYPRKQVDVTRIQSLPMQKTTTSHQPDNRPRKMRLTQSGPLNVVKMVEDDEGSDDTPKEVILQATCSSAYHMQASLEPSRPPSQMVGGIHSDRLGSSLEDLPTEPISEDQVPPDSGTSQQSLTDRQDSLGSVQTGRSAQSSRGDTAQMSGPDTGSAADSARSQLLDELTISIPGGHTLDSWTALAPSCCTHPAEAPPTTPSTDERVVGKTGNKSTLNAIRTVLARTMVLPAELMPQALQRLDLDLALVYRDLYGGACCAAVEALRRDEPLPVPILAVFQHDITQRYLAPGQCTLLAGRPWQIIKDIRSPPPPSPPPAAAAQAAVSSVTDTGTSPSCKGPV